MRIVLRVSFIPHTRDTNHRLLKVALLLDAIGGKGVYLTVDVANPAEMESIAKLVEKYR